MKSAPSLSTDQAVTRQGVRKTAAIAEVLGVYVVGQLVGFGVGKGLGIPLRNPLLSLTPDASAGDLWRSTVQVLPLLGLQYAGWFAVAVLVGWWHRRRGAARYGLTLAGRPLRTHIGAGVVLFAVASLPGMGLMLVHAQRPLGAQVPWRAALFTMDWNHIEFWLAMAVGSYGLVPPLEELFYRGYCQTRLEEDVGAPTAIVATAGLFAFSHSQYHLLNVLNIGMLVTTLCSALAWGYVFYRTRSLVPTILAHALVNVPLKGVALWVAPVGMLLVCLAARRPIRHAAAEWLLLLRGIAAPGQAILISVAFVLFAIGFAMFGDVVIPLGLLCFVAAVVLEGQDKRRRAGESPEPSRA